MDSLVSVEIKNRVETLRKELNYHSQRYYVYDTPEISDYEYAFERVCLVSHGDCSLSFVGSVEFLGGEMVGWYFMLCDYDYLLFVVQKACGQDC